MTRNPALNQPFRVASSGMIDREHPLTFSFDGKQLQGFAGDTLASALLANGVRLVGRSFKYHRPRGIIGSGNEETNALVELRTGDRREPNTRATVVELFEGLRSSSQNRWPSLRHDLLSVNGWFGPLLSAGFYYKTFMWPASFWEKVYEPMIRRAAGLGRIADGADPDRYEASFAFCDVLVVGSGPAGLMAALSAARAGARVTIVEDDFRLGGRSLAECDEIDGMPAAQWVVSAEATLRAEPRVTILMRTMVFGVYDGRTYAAVERVNDHVPTPPAHEPRQRLWSIVAKQCVLAAGAIERPLVFGDNDRPGVMLAGAVRAYVNRWGVAAGREAVVFASDDYALRTAKDLLDRGIGVAAVIDSRPNATATLRELATRTRVISGATVSCALATRDGSRLLKAVEINDSRGRTERIACDVLAMSGGWDPTVHLTSHLGARPRWDSNLHTFVPDALPPGMRVAGSAAGKFELDACLRSGELAGREAAIECGLRAEPLELPRVEPQSSSAEPVWRAPMVRGKPFIDFQNDVTLADLALANREGFRSVEQVKRYTTMGMATDQGKLANVNGMANLAHLKGRTIAEVGTTTFRPPYVPVSIGTLACHSRSREFRPVRITPLHRWAESRGAVFIESGLWMRAHYYPHKGDADMMDAVSREVSAVRNAVGVCDLSTFGKIDIQGTDAATFLDRVYCNLMSTLPVGKVRFGLMLREDGFVLDDGTTARFGEHHYLMTTSTANAGRVMEHLEFCHQVLWPELDVQMVSVTEQWAQIAVAGPYARQLLERVVDPSLDLSNGAFPFLSAATTVIGANVPARLFRLSFSGELGYELAFPARFGAAVLDLLMSRGADLGVLPYGTEALGVLRIEKGHVSGPEINGQTTADDLGMGRLRSAKKDFVGRFMAARPRLTDAMRPAIVGFRPVDRSARLAAGAHFVPAGGPASADVDQGYMTSVAWSPTLGHWIGIGLLANGPQRLREIVRACDPVRGGDVLVEVCEPAFVDPSGERARG